LLRVAFTTFVSYTHIPKGFICCATIMSQYETKVLFNGTISFRDKAAASHFLEALGKLVANSVDVFHGKASPEALSQELQNVRQLLHHFVDNVDTKEVDDDLSMTREATANSVHCIEQLTNLLRLTNDNVPSDELREQLATQFKTLFENLVVSYHCITPTKTDCTTALL
jgi:hypothetical protein